MSGNALKALAEPRRAELLTILRDAGTLSVGDIAERVQITQQAVSLHLKVLEDAGLVEARKEGVRSLYSLKPDGFRPIKEFVEGFWNAKLGDLKKSAEE